MTKMIWYDWVICCIGILKENRTWYVMKWLIEIHDWHDEHSMKCIVWSVWLKWKSVWVRYALHDRKRNRE